MSDLSYFFATFARNADMSGQRIHRTGPPKTPLLWFWMQRNTVYICISTFFTHQFVFSTFKERTKFPQQQILARVRYVQVFVFPVHPPQVSVRR